MDRKDFLPDDGNDASRLIVELKIQARNVAAKLPAQALDVGDIPEQVKQLPGEFKLRPVCHCDHMARMKAKETRRKRLLTRTRMVKRQLFIAMEQQRLSRDISRRQEFLARDM